jgi:hypothetical protein
MEVGIPKLFVIINDITKEGERKVKGEGVGENITIMID